MRRLLSIALLAAAAAGTARAQGASIDPGMSREQVIAKLGRPVSEHSSGARTYLYYANGDEKKYGMHDFVALEDGKVIDAVFRSNARKYNGKSSSPAPVPPEAAIAKGHGGHMPTRHEPAEKAAPPTEKRPQPPVVKKPEPTISKKPEPPASKKPEPPATKKSEPPAVKKSEAQPKAVPPTAKLHEPLKGTDTKKIAPATKSDTGKKKAAPAPTKKP